MKRLINIFLFFILVSCAHRVPTGTGNLGIIIEREHGSIQIVNHTTRTVLNRVEGLGDLSHASAVFDKSQQFVYIFGRDGGLTKIDILNAKIVKRVIQSGNSIGGAISQDGKYIAVSNYTPGGVNIFDAKSLQLVQKIPAITPATPKGSKVIGLVDAPNNLFIFTLFNAGEIWVFDTKKMQIVHKFEDIGKLPYDGLITPDGRYYATGLFGEDGVVVLDLWNIKEGPKKVLTNYGKKDEKLPVYKMPHLEGWASDGDHLYLPGIGDHKLHIINKKTWKKDSSLKVKSQVVFAMTGPDKRKVWVNFAYPNNQFVQIIDTQKRKIIKELKPGKGVLHMEFTPRGEEIWLSVRDENKIQIYDAYTLELVKEIKSKRPSGIFFTNRSGKIGL